MATLSDALHQCTPLPTVCLELVEGYLSDHSYMTSLLWGDHKPVNVCVFEEDISDESEERDPYTLCIRYDRTSPPFEDERFEWILYLPECTIGSVISYHLDNEEWWTWGDKCGRLNIQWHVPVRRVAWAWESELPHSPWWVVGGHLKEKHTRRSDQSIRKSRLPITLPYVPAAYPTLVGDVRRLLCILLGALRIGITDKQPPLDPTQRPEYVDSPSNRYARVVKRARLNEPEE